MKKKILLAGAIALLGAIGSQHVSAQYNTTFPYIISGAAVSSTPTDIIASDGGSTTTLGYAGNYMLIKKLDPLGNVLFDVVYEYHGTPAVGIWPTKIVQTLGMGYIVTGTVTDPTSSLRFPFAAGFDPTGNFLWLNYYPTSAGDNANANFERPNIVYAPDDPTDECYIITLGAQADASSSYPNDCYIDALEISVAGTLKWHNKYMPNWSRSCYSELLDWPQALVHVDAPGYSFYYIGGTQNWWGIPPCSFGYGYYMTAFGIDYLGNIVQNYTTYNTPQYPASIDAVYDPRPLHPDIAITYTFGNTTIGGPLNASVVGFTTLDPSLSPIMTRSYYLYNDVENYASGIAKTQDPDNGFVISTVNSFGHWHQGILKISGTGHVDFFKEYNILADYTALSPRIADVTIPVENYAVATSVDNSTPGSYDMRIIRTDAGGSVCGESDSTVDTSVYSLTPTTYSYTPVAESGTMSLVLTSPTFVIATWNCDPLNPGYRQVNNNPVSNVNEKKNFSIYPTLLNGSNEVNIEIFAANNTSVTLKLSSVDGRLIGTRQYNVTAGNNAFSWNLPACVPGNYIITAESADKSIHNTTRISKI